MKEIELVLKGQSHYPTNVAEEIVMIRSECPNCKKIFYWQIGPDVVCCFCGKEVTPEILEVIE